MRVSATKTEPRIERNIYLTSKRIKGYGQENDYPQKILEIVNASGTGSTCVGIYVKFVEGAGFEDLVFSETVLNSKGEKADSLLRKFAKDLSQYNGFACLVKYNGAGLPYAYYNIPFEHCRLEINGDKQYTGRVAVYNDWTDKLGQPFQIEKVKFLNRFNPKKVIEEMEEAGGPESYYGQVFYYTADGEWEYPLSPFDSVVTDMLSEEGCSTVKYRNVKNNFLPAGILVRKGKKPKTLDNGTIDPYDPYNQEIFDSADDLRKAQGDMNSSKIWVVDVDADEEIPELIDFNAKNYDKEFTYTEESVQENIGRKFMVPPILRGVDVGAGFGADLMTNAYDFMNSVTGNERRMLETAFQDLMEFYMIKFNNFTILPLEYVGNIVTPVTP